jgi:signal transduction histidine kinase/ActR/RegA family two-component response regulator
VVLHTIAANMRTEDLLQQSQTLTSELQLQQQELQKTNERLEHQALNLQKSESLLKSKQDELRSANEQLQEKARQLSEQMRQVEVKNREVELAKAALEDKAEQLALSSRYKSEFLANMSHELRTPLNSLLILARLLSDNGEGNLTPKQVEFAQTIFSSGNDLLSLINDILDLAKIESGTVTLNIGQERFDDLRAYVQRSFNQVARDKDLEFSVAVDPDLPPTLETDGKRLQQIIKNLLSNAFKFTSHGTVALRIGRAAAGEIEGAVGPEPMVAFSVSDTGIGIPAHKRQVIFEAFQQADGTTSREYGGTGLGLSISRELARVLGGEIRVASEPGRGSTFTLLLPLAHHPAADGAPPSRLEGVAPARFDSAARPALSDDVLAALAGRKVLLVDDDIRNVFALTSALEHYGLQVVQAETGREGIETLKRVQDIDLVLMDLMMPDLDGYDTIRIVRQLEPYRKLPIVAVTAKAMLGDRDKCIRAGATDYVAKPVDIEALLVKLAACLEAA